MSNQQPDKPIAIRVILSHTAPCWECSQRLQACKPDGSHVGRYGCSPNYKGPAIAYVAMIDGHERKLHRTCAERLGFECIK